jgi:putative transposase
LAKKKAVTADISERRLIIDPADSLSISRQCELLDLNRSSYYYEPCGESAENLRLMRLMDEQYLKTPFYGVRRMRAWLCREGNPVNPKRVRRLMRLMDLVPIYPKPRLSQPDLSHRIYPYLLKGLTINRPNQVWSTDITYIPMAKGFLYLVAVIDWFSRYVLSWRISNSLDVDFCLDALEAALVIGRPEIFNTDQGSQFTSDDFTGRLKSAEIRISMDGKGRAIDNIFVERLWRTVKYEHVYLHAPETGLELWEGLDGYFDFYNTDRLHQSLDYRTPSEVHFCHS